MVYGLSVRIGRLAIIGVFLLNSGCASLMSSAASGLADNLSAAVLNQNDPETVRDGAPAYLLLLDSFLEGSPDDPDLNAAAANLYATYGAVFAEDADRAREEAEQAYSREEETARVANQAREEADAAKALAVSSATAAELFILH